MDRSINSKVKIAFPILILTLICLATMDLFSYSYFFFCLAFALFCLKPGRKLFVGELSLIALFVLSLSFLLFSKNAAVSIFGILKLLPYPLCYVLGASMPDDNAECESESVHFRIFYATVTAAALGSLIHYILNWLININSSSRNTIDIWTNQIRAATGQAALAVIPLALAIACIFSTASKKLKIISFITLAVILIYNLILSGRTLIMLMLIALAIALIFKLKNQKSKKLKTIVIFLIICALLFVAYESNTFGVKDYIEDSPLYQRFFSDSGIDIDEDSRIDSKKDYFEHFFDYIWGGNNLQAQYGYAHDIFLDTYDDAGLIALLAIILFLIISLKHFIKCLKDKTLPFNFRLTVLCIYSVLYVQFMIEPILQGVNWMFAAFCLIDGYVCRILYNHRNLKIEEKSNENC